MQCKSVKPTLGADEMWRGWDPGKDTVNLGGQKPQKTFSY